MAVDYVLTALLTTKRDYDKRDSQSEMAFRRRSGGPTVPRGACKDDARPQARTGRFDIVKGKQMNRPAIVNNNENNNAALHAGAISPCAAPPGAVRPASQARK
jgi:hypothetical protein